MVVEVMGRHTGWIAVMSGIAGGADVILIPEQPITVERACEEIQRRHERGKDFSIVVVSEGYELTYESGERRQVAQEVATDEFGHVRLGGVGHELARDIEERTGFETRVTVLGHVQRGGSPTPRDRVLATRYGLKAADLVHERKFGRMAALHGDASSTSRSPRRPRSSRPCRRTGTQSPRRSSASREWPNEARAPSLPLSPLRPNNSTSGNDRCRRGGTRKFCRWVVRSTAFKPWPRARGSSGSFVAVREDPVHRQPVAVEVVARRVEDDEVDPGRGASAIRSRSGVALQKNGLSRVLKSARCGIAVPFR